MWQANGAYSGVSVKNNTVENIFSADNYRLTTVTISMLAESIASWLTTNSFADVNDIFATGTEDDITALIAQFNNASWQAPV